MALFEKNLISDPKSIKLELVMSSCRSKLEHGYLNTNSELDKYSQVLEEWFEDEKKFIDELISLVIIIKMRVDSIVKGTGRLKDTDLELRDGLDFGLIQASSSTPIYRKAVNRPLPLDLTDLSNDTINFDTCEFYHEIAFNGTNLINGLSFNNCVFRDVLRLNNINTNPAQSLAGVTFTNCSFENLSIVNNSKITGDLKIINCEIENLGISDFTSTQGSITISNSTINSFFEFKNNNINKEFTLNLSSKINAPLKWENNNCESYIFAFCYITKELVIDGGKLVRGITFTKVNFESKFEISNTIIESNSTDNPVISFNNSNFDETCSIELINSTSTVEHELLAPNIFIRSTSFHDFLVISGDQSYRNSFYKINNVKVDASNKLEGDIVLRDLEIRDCMICGANYKSYINLDRIRVERLRFENFSNHKTIQLTDVRSNKSNKSRLIIDYTVLGDAQFLLTDLKSFNRIDITHSDLTRITTSSVTWFDNNKVLDDFYKLSFFRYSKNIFLSLFYIKTYRKKFEYLFNNDIRELSSESIKLLRNNRLKKLEGKRELFRQLRAVMERQGDRFQALIFKQGEMKIHNRIVKNSYNIGDRIILLLSRSNSFGLNWLLPSMLFLIFTLLFYCLIIVSHTPFGLEFKFDPLNVEGTFYVFYDHLNILGQLLNPIRDIGKVIGIDVNEKLSLCTYIIDFIHKVLSSYLIFQTVSAFRKYIK